MIWITHVISEALATATFMETDQNELRCPKCLLNQAQTVSPPVQPQKQSIHTKQQTMFAHTHTHTHTANKPSSLHLSPNKGMKNENTKMVAQDTLIIVHLWHDVLQMFSCLHEIHPNMLKSSDLIKPPRQKPRNSSKDTSSVTKFHPPCAWRS